MTSLLYGFVVVAWLISPNLNNRSPVPFASMIACEVAKTKIKRAAVLRDNLVCVSVK